MNKKTNNIQTNKESIVFLDKKQHRKYSDLKKQEAKNTTQKKHQKEKWKHVLSKRYTKTIAKENSDFCSRAETKNNKHNPTHKNKSKQEKQK